VVEVDGGEAYEVRCETGLEETGGASWDKEEDFEDDF
jgi:hypothetical protein